MNQNSSDHTDFKPVYDWVFIGKGKLIYGGTKYLEEIPVKYLKLIKLLADAGKAIHVNDEEVDIEERRVNHLLQDDDFDDQHLVGLLIVSKCKLIASRDKRAYPFFKHTLFFHPARNKPRIYCSIANKDLLCDKYILPICT